MIELKALWDNEQTLSYLEEIARYVGDESNGSCCVVKAMQMHRKSFYAKLTKDFDVDISICSRNRHPVTFMLNVIVGYEALIEIKNPSQLLNIYQLVGEQAMSGIYLFDKRLKQKVLSIGNSRPHNEMLEQIYDDRSHLAIVIDEDSATSVDLGYVVQIHYGENCRAPAPAIRNSVAPKKVNSRSRT
jgi:hypothetical protein